MVGERGGGEGVIVTEWTYLRCATLQQVLHLDGHERGALKVLDVVAHLDAPELLALRAATRALRHVHDACEADLPPRRSANT